MCEQIKANAAEKKNLQMLCFPQNMQQNKNKITCCSVICKKAMV